ncbi:MAG: endonuclease/exonuclease/phosphatase family protein [Acidimicrobiia bacterium]|nr:endonuclease/exonuclease/phosphatase family protein [Acidimicrobiia bacterium]
MRDWKRASLAWVAIIAVLGLLLGATPASAGSTKRGPRPTEVTAMTQNLYLGANLQPLFGATGPELILESAAVYDHVLQVDFPARADAIAALVAEERPDLIGLQEVALWQKLQRNEDGTWVPVETIDYLTILLDALADRGLSYRAEAVNVNFTNETFPLPITFDLSTTATLTMRDAILVRERRHRPELRVIGSASGNYEATTLVPSPGDPSQPLPVIRGWSYIDVRQRGGKRYRFVNTHLEAWSEADCDAVGRPSLAEPFVRNRQAAELVELLAGSPQPVVLSGDLNAAPDDPCDAFQIFRDAGFVDGWAEAMPGIPAPTAGQTDDLDNVPSTLDHQIDYVLFNRPDRLRAVPGSGEILGEELDDRTPSGLWPSDHAGLAVTLRFVRSRQRRDGQ